MKNLYYFSLIVCFLFYSQFINAQDKDLQNYYADKIKTNGVLVSTDITQIPTVDIEKIIKYDFNEYRSYDTHQQVKLKNGPVIQLLSITERLNAGEIIDKGLVEKKKSIAGVSYPHSTMPVLDIRIGYKPAVTEREKTTIFMIPKDNN